MKRISTAKDRFDGGKIEDLFCHVRRGDRGDVDYIKTVDQKLLLNARNTYGDTVLMIATEKRDLDLCKEILKKCPSLLYDVNNHNQTVLHYAAYLCKSIRPLESFKIVKKIRRYERISIIDLFVSAGVDDLATNNEGDIFMKFKSWMNMQDSKGYTALLEAVEHGNLHIVKRLIEVDREYNLGLSKFVGKYRGKTPLDLAAEMEAHDIVKLLADEGDPYSDYVPYSTAMELFDRASSEDLDYIKTVELNVLLNSRDEESSSVLFMATEWNQLACCKTILKRCPSLLYHHNYSKCGVLHIAALDNNYSLIDFFVSAGLKAVKSEDATENMTRFQKWINLQNCNNNTALISAVIKSNYAIVKRFLEVDRRYKLGLSEIVGRGFKTALQWAMHYDNHEVIKALNGRER